LVLEPGARNTALVSMLAALHPICQQQQVTTDCLWSAMAGTEPSINIESVRCAA
jgi:hypothetical protein